MDLLGTRYLEQIHFESPLKCCSQCLHRLENLQKCTSECSAEQGFVSTLLNKDPDYRSINDTGYLLCVLWKVLPSCPFLTTSATAIYPCYIHMDLFHSAPPLSCVWQVIQGMFCFYDKHSLSLYGNFNYLNKEVYIAPSRSKLVLSLKHTGNRKIQQHDPSLSNTAAHSHMDWCQ